MGLFKNRNKKEEMYENQSFEDELTDEELENVTAFTAEVNLNLMMRYLTNKDLTFIKETAQNERQMRELTRDLAYKRYYEYNQNSKSGKSK